GYNFDFIDSGKTLRLINVTGTVEAAVQLKIGVWQHVAATCDRSGRMRLYLDGKLMGELQGKPHAPSANPRPMPPLEKVAEFAAKLESAGLGRTFAAGQAGMIVSMVSALHDHRRARKLYTMTGIPPADPDRVDDLYCGTIDKLTLGLMDYLAAHSGDRDGASMRIQTIARRSLSAG
ncbi:MAG TPA: LamG-like jellyroll fold domain-containing protein, partial [Fimbriimonadaceae bacterium]|nr:LamG-like jellyroll fold domain-containing protein [Fimbriimonadaceae bacterium]